MDYMSYTNMISILDCNSYRNLEIKIKISGKNDYGSIDKERSVKEFLFFIDDFIDDNNIDSCIDAVIQTSYGKVKIKKISIIKSEEYYPNLDIVEEEYVVFHSIKI